MKQFVQLSEGARIAYQTYGNGSHVILLYHGLVGGSWIGPDWHDALARADVRLIIPERPGYGDSAPIALKSVAGWMPIVRQLVQAWDVSSVEVVGCSAGAPYAYATALALPEAVSCVWISSGVPAVYEERVLRHYKEPDQTAYKSYAAMDQGTLQAQYVAQMEAASERIRGKGLEYLESTLHEILAQRCFGMAQESRLQILPWNLPLPEIRQPVTLLHAKEDEMVPYAAAGEMTHFLTDCRFREVDASGFVPGESVHMRANAENVLSVLRAYAV